MNILGINYGHDSGASLISNLNVISCVNEERLSRRKMHHGFPYKSIDEVLSIGGLSLSDIDIIAIEGKLFSPTQEHLITFQRGGDWRKSLLNFLCIEKLVLGTHIGVFLTSCILIPHTFLSHYHAKRYFISRGFRGKFKFVDHHQSHAATAYFTQQHNQGLAITLDASGEGYCSKVFVCRDNEMKLVHSIPSFFSPAYFYAYITKLLGFKPIRHEGKITGLAAYGDASITSEILSNFIGFDESKLSFTNLAGFHTKAIEKLQYSLSGFSREDIAAGIQKICEELIAKYINACVQKFSNMGLSANIFLAGGMFANVKINQKLSSLSCVNSLYVFPNMGDGGLGLGAALVVLGKKVQFDTLYLGRAFDDQSILDAITGAGFNYYMPNSIAFEVARLLSDNNIVARYAGGSEYGPRSLGNRSILYSASDKAVNGWLNERLDRTEFMPFAPVVREIDMNKYFNIDKFAPSYRHMTLACDVTSHGVEKAPATTHIDNTARPQLINFHDNPSYYDILSEYEKLSGEGILVNTSFNLHEEPIVYTPAEALNTFSYSKLDYLAIGSYIVCQKK